MKDYLKRNDVICSLKEIELIFNRINKNNNIDNKKSDFIDYSGFVYELNPRFDD